MKKQRSAFITLALAAAVAFLPACSDSGGSGKSAPAQSQNSGEKTASIDTSNLNTAGQLPILKKKVPLTMLVVQDTNIKNMETNDYTLKLEKDVNVDLSFEYLPAGDEAKQKLSVLISSGSKLPDMVNTTSLSDIEAYTYGKQGFFLPLNDYVDQVSIYLKKYLETGENVEQYKPYMYAADGKMYGMPRIVEDPGNEWSGRIWIDKTWLNKLGLQMPKTTDDFYNVLKAFREKDPNGNGKQDELPLIGCKGGWNSNVYDSLLGAFTYVNSGYDYMQVENGKLQLSYMQNGWEKGLEYLHKLCSEKLLSPLTFTQDQNQLKQILEDKNAQLVGSLTTGSMSIYQVASKRKEDMTHLPPLTGPDGVCYANYWMSGLPTPAGYITKDCSDPVAAFMVFDYMYSRDMVLQGRHGTKGVDWKDPDPGKPALYESLGYKPLVQYINPIWGTVQNHQWGEVHPTARTFDMYGGVVWDGNPYDSQYMTAQAVPDYKGKVPKETVQKLIYTPEEADQIAEITATLTTYRDEATVAFITGTRPLTDWDNYLKDLENIGVEKYLEVAQKAYDRMQKK